MSLYWIVLKSSMMRNNPTLYFVEGRCEEKLINELKKEPSLLVPGRIKVLNVLTHRISVGSLITFKKNTNICFVFDTDGEQNLSTYNYNISVLKKYVPGVHVYNFVQINNLEDELLKATNIKRIEDLTGSKSSKDFKTDFLSCSNCRQLLDKHNFKIENMWKSEPIGSFAGIAQDAKYFITL